MSKYSRKIKFEKFSTEATKNALRLHFDSILLYKNKSFASAFHLSVLALEEIAKSDWIDHYVETTTSNFGLPEPDGEDEQQWLKLLYIHTKKHSAFVNQQFHTIEKSFYNFAQSSQLEHKKQKSIYVGFEKVKKKINAKSKISTPNQIKDREAKQIISLNNQVLINQCARNINNDFDYGPFDKFEMLNYETMLRLKNEWTFKTKLLEAEVLIKK